MDTANSAPTQTRSTVFLSIIVYRNFRSIPLLNETFLMLSGQTCPDFEVIVAGAETETPDDEAVKSLIEHFPSFLSEKTRLVPSAGKTRAETLNHALDHVRGHMVCFIDEGDLLFDNWVESLQKTAQDAQCIVYAYAIEQVWELVAAEDEGCLLRSVGKLDPSSCHPFDIADSIAAPEFRGTCFAFPASAPHDERPCFDETLTSLERWDYLLRSLDKYPLATFDQPASLVRVWRRPIDPGMRPAIWDKTIPMSGETATSEEQSQAERLRIIGDLATSTPRISELYDPFAPTREEADLLSRQMLARRCILTCIPANDADSFAAPADIGHRVGWTLRWTIAPHVVPLDRIEIALEDMDGCMTLSDFNCTVEDASGDEHRFDFALCEHNGLQIDCGHAIFLVDRPVLSLRFATPVVPTCIHLKIECRLGVEKEHVGQFTRGKTALWAGRMKRWALRRINRL